MAYLDLEVLSTMTPVVCQCVKCYALFHSYDIDLFLADRAQLPASEVNCRPCQVGRHHHHPTCPFCGVRYIPTESYPWPRIHAYLIKCTRPTWPFTITDQAALPGFLHHCWRLGHSITRINNLDAVPAVKLLKTLAAAQSFVHFVSCSPLPQEVVGALLTLAQRIPVRGLTPYEANLFHFLDPETPLFHTGICEPAQVRRTIDHDYTFIVDGVLALQGDFCASSHEYQIAQEGKTSFAAITTLDRVTTLNNQIFSPLWARQSRCGDVILMA